jgi:hypothetical protein
MSWKTRWVFAVSTICLAILATGSVAQAYYQAEKLVPSPVYTTPQDEVTIYMNGIMTKLSQFSTVDQVMAPAPGDSSMVTSFFDIFTEVSLDGGATWAPMSTHGTGHMLYTSVLSPPELYQTEMLSLDIAGGDLPAGVMIRESPTLASTGQTTIKSLPGGGYTVDSFFDVFTEISLDDGQTWTPSQNSMHLVGSPEPATLSLLALGGLFLFRRRKENA